MVVVHIVLFKFRPNTDPETTGQFLSELQKLKYLPCVLDQKLVVGGSSITTPIARSKGFQYCLLSYHKDKTALDEYQASDEHHQVTSKYMWPFNEDLMRFDFETDEETLLRPLALVTPPGTPMAELLGHLGKSPNAAETSGNDSCVEKTSNRNT